MSIDSEQLSTRQKLQALRRVAEYRPVFTAGLVTLGAFVAFLEGVGLGFIYPIIETAQSEDPTSVSGPVMEAFISTYEFFGIPFSLGYLIVGVAIVMTVRYTMSFIIQWFAVVLANQYEKHLRTQAFQNALNAEIEYYDAEGTDDILNAIITETRYSGTVIEKGVRLMEILFLTSMYLSVMLYTAPSMTVIAVALLGGITVLLRFVIEPAVNAGSRVAEANERVQQSVQAGTQGIRDVKLFGLQNEVFSTFSDAIEQYANSEIDLGRNDAGIRNAFELSAAITIFVLIYVGFTFTGLALGELGIFLIAMFQLAPRVSSLNGVYYKVEGNLSHVVRTFSFLDELNQRKETDGDRSISQASRIEFDNIQFSYNENEPVLQGLSFSATRGDFIAFVGQSGAGKSTIVSLLARMYDADSGDIRVDGVPIEEYDITEWRERIAVVRQQPYIFTDTLEHNVTVGNRGATRRDVERVCEIAKVTEFVDDLPNGYESQLGDNGVRLSGGQRQRVALARALLKEADFLVLDEATSDLDSGLEKEVQAAIESMDREYGIITIAHRLSTVQNADRIHTVEDGEIVESGTHGELIDDGGEYAKLYTIQSE